MTPGQRHSPGTTTLLEVSRDRLTKLCHAAEVDEQANVIGALLERIVEPWGSRPLTQRPSWPSHIGDDHTPIEFSMTFGAKPEAKPELRVLIEPLGRNPSLVSNRAAAWAVLRSLAKEFTIDLRRLEQIQDLYWPANPKGVFSAWIAVGLSAGRTPDFKLYINPAAHGSRLAPRVVEETLVRLGFPDAWPVVSKSLLRRGPDLDELNYVSLDLSASPDARLKIYSRHFRCTAPDLEEAASASLSYRTGELTDFLKIVAGTSGAVFESRSPQTCLTFVGREGSRPVAATLHFPINSYAPDDDAVRERVLQCHERFGISPEPYARAAAAFANRPLDESVGVHTYVSFRRYGSEARLTTYLAVEAYRPGTVEQAVARGSSGVTNAPGEFECCDLVSDHPFAARLRRESVDSERLRPAVANLRVALRLALDRIHRTPLVEPAVERMARNLAAAEPIARHAETASEQEDSEELAAARRLDSRFAELIESADVHEAIGASVAAVVLFGHIEELVGNARRRGEGEEPGQNAPLGRPDIGLLDSLALDEVVPVQGLDAAWKGASALGLAGWRFLDDLYALTYCGSAS